MENNELNKIDDFPAFVRDMRNIAITICVLYILLFPVPSPQCYRCYTKIETHEIRALKSTAVATLDYTNFYKPSKKVNSSYPIWSSDGCFRAKSGTAIKASFSRTEKLQYQSWLNHKKQVYRMLYNH